MERVDYVKLKQFIVLILNRYFKNKKLGNTWVRKHELYLPNLTTNFGK